MYCRILLSLVALCWGLTSSAQTNLIRNPSFEEGEQTPASWSLSAGTGGFHSPGRTGGRCLSITGSEEAMSTFWLQDAVAVEPFTTYRFSYFARSLPGAAGGCIISGPQDCNYDTNAGDDWEAKSMVFTTRPGQDSTNVRLGHWQKTGTVLFDDVELTLVEPVHRTFGEVTLGEGESIEDGRYVFSAPLSAEGRNYCRALSDFTAGFNTHRWVFGPGAYVVYRLGVGAAVQTGATVTPNVGYHQSGQCIVEASADGETFVEIGRISEAGSQELALPDELFPASEITLRLLSPGEAQPRPDSDPGSFQIYNLSYTATLGEKLPDMVGSTRYVDTTVRSPRIAVDIEDLGELVPSGDNTARIAVSNRTEGELSLRAYIEVISKEGTSMVRGRAVDFRLAAGASESPALPYMVESAGPHSLRLVVTESEEALFLAQSRFVVPSLYAADYGYPVGADEACELWACEGTYKVSRERPAVAAGEPGMQPLRLSAARNEFEPVQLVLRPTRDLQGLTAKASGLTGPGGATLDAENIAIAYVYYHEVKRPTDEEGCVGWWPDALPPLDEPIDLSARQNQPLWITVRVPVGQAAGDYTGTVSLQARGWSAEVPIALHVWDFELPERSSVVSAFGLGQGDIWRYQNITDAADRDRVWDLYMQNFRDHRIAPYTFWRRGIDVGFTGVSWEGGTFSTEDPFAGERCLEIVDDSDGLAVDAHSQRFEVDAAAEYVLTYAVKTAEPGQEYQLTFQSYDADSTWISGHNLDIVMTGNGEWEEKELRFVPRDRSPRAGSLTLVVRPVRWTEDGKLTGTVWIDEVKLVKAGEQESLIPGGGFESAEMTVRPEVDFTAWDLEAERCLDGYKFNSFQLPLAGMGSGTFYSRQAGRIGPYEQGTPEYRRAFGQYCGQLQDHLEEKGWLDEAFIYWFDEPEPRDYEFVKEGMNEIKLAGPKLRRMLTEEPIEPLYGDVDIWCPVLPNHHPEICAQRQELGEDIWWYVCTGPKAPWPTLFIDHSAVDLRVWLWMTWKWNVQGILVWQSNYWTSGCAFPDSLQNPWEDPMGYVTGYGNPPGYVAYWGNGDGRFIYPPNMDPNRDKSPYVQGPVDSIRWEMLREGIEDFEYFTLLKGLVEARGDCPERALLEVPQEVVKSQTDFTRDPLSMYDHRTKLAEAIERLK